MKDQMVSGLTITALIVLIHGGRKVSSKKMCGFTWYSGLSVHMHTCTEYIDRKTPHTHVCTNRHAGKFCGETREF